MKKPLPRSAPEAQGIASSRILDFVEAVEKNIHELHSFMLVRHGSVAAEGWWSPYAPEIPRMMFSLSKSFTSTAIGLAVAEGCLTVNDPVISFFPDDLPAEVSENLAAMRVRDLLTMSTGHAEVTINPVTIPTGQTWVQNFLAHPVTYAPGTHFVYNSGATYMLSAIVHKFTGLTLIDYLEPRLFEPLGIENPTWENSPEGINVGGWGLKIRTEDIAKFGQLYVQKGMWQGKQLVPEAWVQEATSYQVDNRPNQAIDWAQGYCYQFWRCRHNAYRADGAFGQYCIVMPDQDAVLAITSGVSDMQSVLNLVWDILLPAIGDPLPADSAAHEKLTEKLSKLAFDSPQGQSSSVMVPQVSGKTYQIEPSDTQIETFKLDFDTCIATIRDAQGEHRVMYGEGAWRDGITHMFRTDTRYVASGVWEAEDTFILTIRCYETPFYQTLTCQYKDDQIALESNVNVAFGETTHALVGRAI